MLKRLLAILVRVLGVFVLIQVVLRLVKRIHPVPCPFQMAGLLDNPLRRAVMPPGRVLDAVGIEPGTRVLELGPGPGYFTPEAARRVGKDGRVYAVDIQPEMVALVRAKAERLGLKNITAITGDAYELPLPGGSIDLAFLVTVFGEIPDRPRALRELFRVLCPGARLSITEAFPDPDYLTMGTVTRLAEEAGFVREETTGSWFIYTANFRKPDA